MAEKIKMKVQIWRNDDTILEIELEVIDGTLPLVKKGAYANAETIHDSVQSLYGELFTVQ